MTHAPVAPWFSPGKYQNGAYLTIDRTVGALIDWYNIQFYNRKHKQQLQLTTTVQNSHPLEGGGEYTTCDNLLRASSSAWPQSSVFEIAASGVALDKLVIGKPATESDATNGYINPNTLASCLADAKNSGWSEYLYARASCRGTDSYYRWRCYGLAIPQCRIRLDENRQEPVLARVKTPTTDLASRECDPKALKATDLWFNLYPDTLEPQHQQLP